MIGTLLGNRYELLEKIGEGGMAEVYKARCHLLNRYVAVKVLKEEFSRDSQFVEKFKREATAAASLSDNNIVNIYDVGSQDEINYIVMEYVKGRTLKEVIRLKNRLEVEESVNIAIQIAKALQCAHRNNIIHRDIKPHNILVTEEGIVKVTDFGIAKAANSVTITNTDKVIGSAHYFSPEQAKGSFVDCRTDIYSLGIVMYEMVTGRVPYDADSPVSVALKHIQEPVVPPIQLNLSLPSNFNSVILKCIEKEPIRRYQDIKSLLEDLDKVKNNEEVDVKVPNYYDDRTQIMDAVKVKTKNNNEDEYIDEDDFEEEEFEKGSIDNKKKKMIAIATAIILVIAVGFASGYIIYNKISPNGKASAQTVTIPDIVGKSKEEAKKLVEEKNLKFVVGSTEKSDRAEGTVISCFPNSGTQVKANSEVRVIVSSGVDKQIVPDLKTIDLEVAKDILKRYNLKLGNVTEAYDDNIAKNCVISQSPDKDNKVEANSSVDVVISKGPKITYATVPSLNGKTLEEARTLLSNSNLKLGTSKSVETSDKSLDGKIFEQNIEGNTKVTEGTAVNVTYYVYKEEKPNEGNEDGNKPNDGNTEGDTSTNGNKNDENKNNNENQQNSTGTKNNQ
ncbi:Stk1 family PASTA domain-containing Ser/Thr kinase [Clostridium lundense]|uniref:Stk1 family PASTA domain-containing Ser/Thr kinase n=1 Tax=Clostridium lundense TaxID=319475 RepID=UPI00048179AA|nr:Stk1 family PASTA domain-containing Ser/Thr kinase [Clostridium lundense]